MYYIGLMAGTSFDGVDAVITKNERIIAHNYLAYNANILAQLKHISQNPVPLASVAQLDLDLAQYFVKTSNELIKKSGLKKADITAIGSHGQTIFHAPKRYSWQLAHPAIIAQKTAMTVVADFRMGDIAAGGEGAPLTPFYHQYLLKDNNGIIINLGGIANMTIVRNGLVIGFDVGPANTLMDNWVQKHQNKPYDKNGTWASSGQIIQPLLTRLLADDYFQKPPPKSSGFEYFNLTWLRQFLSGDENPADIQATLLALTTHSIAKAIEKVVPKDLAIYLCGGGIHNKALLVQLNTLCHNPITTTEALGIHPDYLEAAAFAFFAKQTLNHKPSNLTRITGANNSCILGAIYQPFKEKL